GSRPVQGRAEPGGPARVLRPRDPERHGVPVGRAEEVGRVDDRTARVGRRDAGYGGDVDQFVKRIRIAGLVAEAAAAPLLAHAAGRGPSGGVLGVTRRRDGNTDEGRQEKPGRESHGSPPLTNRGKSYLLLSQNTRENVNRR